MKNAAITAALISLFSENLTQFSFIFLIDEAISLMALMFMKPLQSIG